MSYPGWMIAKWQRQRAENAKPYKQMKDRDMTGVEVVFRKDTFSNYYYEDMKQPESKITLTYLANLAGRKGCSKYYSYHGYGGWVQFLTLNEKQFTRMKGEIERLGGEVILKFNTTI